MDRDAGGFRKFLKIRREATLLHLDHLVRAPGRKHPHLPACLRKLLVEGKGIGRILRRAERLHVRYRNQMPWRKALSPDDFRALFPYLFRVRRVKRLLDVEISAELEMGPVVDRVADRPWQDPGERKELVMP